jgi:hypothetical protein
MDDGTIKESAKAARAVAKTTGKAIDAGREVGGWLNKIFGRAIVNTVDLYWTDRVVARRIEAAIYDWKRLHELLASTGAELKRLGIKRTYSLPPKVALPLLEHATMENEKSLRKLWAKLLASALSGTEGVTRTYVAILGELSGAEAKALKKMFDEWSARDPKQKKWSEGLYSAVSYEQGVDPPSSAIAHKMNRLGLVEPALIGLLVMQRPDAHPKYGDDQYRQDEAAVAGDLSVVKFTALGESFCRAVGLGKAKGATKRGS